MNARSGDGGGEVSLEPAVAAALKGSAARILFLEWGGRRYVVKRMARKPRGRFKRALLAVLCRVLFPGHVRRGGLTPGDGRLESTRVRALAEAGARVPRVALVLPDAVVYEHCGETLSQHLPALAPERRRRVVMAALEDLARFHQAGHWHGGAQFRNLVVQAGEGGAEAFCRIDFEEDFQGRFSLPLLQMYDLGLFLADALAQADAAGDPVARGLELMAAYRRQHWSPGHGFVLGRLALLARPVAGLAPLIGRFGNKESRRVLALARLLLAAARADAAAGGAP